MFLSLHRDPFYQQQMDRYRGGGDQFNQYHRLRREMDDLLSPTLYLLQNMSAPRLIANERNRKDSKNVNVFEVKLNVENFSPEELNIKLVDDCVLVEGKHEEKMDDEGYISRHFIRRYALPKDVLPESITCNLSSDGYLQISAPRMIPEQKDKERRIPINFTGQPATLNENMEEGQGTKKIDDGNVPQIG